MLILFFFVFFVKRIKSLRMFILLKRRGAQVCIFYTYRIVNLAATQHLIILISFFSLMNWHIIYYGPFLFRTYFSIKLKIQRLVTMWTAPNRNKVHVVTERDILYIILFPVFGNTHLNWTIKDIFPLTNLMYLVLWAGLEQN